MNIYKNTILSGIFILATGLTFTMLPFAYISIMLISASAIYGIYFLTQNYDINYSYWFSFISQLLGLLLIVASFVLMMVIIFNGMLAIQ